MGNLAEKINHLPEQLRHEVEIHANDAITGTNDGDRARAGRRICCALVTLDRLGGQAHGLLAAAPRLGSRLSHTTQSS